MICRNIVHVQGPPGAGKTAFVEALLGRLEHLVTCVRAERDDSLSGPVESARTRSADLRRFASAGACCVAHYRFPACRTAHEDFYLSGFMQEYSEAIIVEGDCPVAAADLAVWVGPALPAGESLLVRETRSRSSDRGVTRKSLERALDDPEEAARVLEELFGMHLSGSTSARVTGSRKKGSTRAKKRWSITSSCRGIEQAQLVVVSARDESDMQRGESMLEEVARLRKDEAVFADVMGFRGTRVPITSVVARLRDSADPGLKKAVARVKRALHD